MKPQANKHDVSVSPAFFKRNALFSALIGALSFFPFAAQATPWNGTVTTTTDSGSNPTVIGFGGQEWVVIGNDTEGGVYSSNTGNTSPSSTTAPTNSITLLLKSGSAGNGYANSAFNASYTPFIYSGQDYYNYYNGQTLQAALAGIAAALGKEQGVINARDLLPVTGNNGWCYYGNCIFYGVLDTGDGINGTAAYDQLLWALSYPEWVKLGDTDVRKYTDATAASAWWLRSPFGLGVALAGRADGAGYGSIFVDNPSYAVRPAFNLNLTSVLFTSESSAAAGSGKSGAAAGGAYSGSAKPTGAQKYTFLVDQNVIKTPELTLTGGTSGLNFAFTGAETGTNANGQMYVSGFLQGSSTDHYYAKYADAASLASGAFDAAGSGGALTGVTSGAYFLHIFGEEANSYLYSDFASESVDFSLSVDASGHASDLVLLSDVAFGLDGGTIGLLGSYTKTWTLGAGDNTLHIAYGDAEISGNIGGSGGLVKTGGDTLTLSGANTYSGMTTVQEGILKLGSGGGIADSSGLTLYDGAAFKRNGQAHSLDGKTLNVHGKATYSGALSAANANLNFYGTTLNDTTALLTVDGTVSLIGSIVSLYLDASAPSLQAGDRILLIDSTGDLTDTPSNETVTVTQGSDTHILALSTTTVANQLIALMAEIDPDNGDGSGNCTRCASKALAEGYLSSVALLNSGADFAERSLPDAARLEPGPQVFGTVGGGRIRYTTGAHFDIDATHLIAGLSSSLDLAQGRATVGAFFEHGEGDYDTRNDCANAKVKGSGDSEYSGVGVLGRFDADNGTYAKATLRSGRVKTDFHSSGVLPGVRTEYKSSAAYYGASL
ncbi:MAG: autotransporter-associated beta strand repeat-containing protein, partial [Candidatus Accumulibacter sp.]|nr:autotransporter-associated beta strand repeat-containing protein [Accumulibacter sp.]